MENFTLQDLAAILFGVGVFVAVSMLLEDNQRRARAIYTFIMSHWPAIVPTTAQKQREHGSYAVEPTREPSGTEDRNVVPSLVEQLEALDDDELLDILAQLRDEEGEYRFAESRVAKFVPGRVEDRLAQVRDVRGTQKPAPPGRLLHVRDSGGKRVISFR